MQTPLISFFFFSLRRLYNTGGIEGTTETKIFTQKTLSVLGPTGYPIPKTHIWCGDMYLVNCQH